LKGKKAANKFKCSYRQSYKYVLFLFFFLLVVLKIAMGLESVDPLKKVLAWVLPLFTALILAGIVLFFVLEFKTIRAFYSDVSSKTWFFFFCILAFALVSRIFLIPHFHTVYDDEPQLIDVGRNMAFLGRAEHCSYKTEHLTHCSFTTKPVGWPFLTGLLIRFLGADDFIIIYAASVLGALGCAMMFFLSYALFRKEFLSLLSSLILCFDRLSILLSRGSDSIVPALFFVLCFMAAGAVFAHTRKKGMFFLTAALFLFVIYSRVEYVFLGVLLFAYILMKRGDAFEGINAAACCIVILPFLTVYVLFARIFLFVEHNANYGAGLLFSQFFFEAGKILGGGYLPVAFLPLIAAGVYYGFRKHRAETWLMLLWLFSFLLFYTAWDYSQQERLFLINSVPLTVFSALGVIFAAKLVGNAWKVFPLKLNVSVSRIEKYASAALVLVIILAASVNFREANNDVPSALLLETEMVNRVKKLNSGNCFILTKKPMIYGAIPSIRAIDIDYLATNERFWEVILPKESCMLFVEDIFCDERYMRGRVEGVESCALIKNSLELSLIESYQRNHNVVRVYEARYAG